MRNCNLLVRFQRYFLGTNLKMPRKVFKPRRHFGRTSRGFKILASATFESALQWNLTLLRFFCICSGAPFNFKDESLFVDASLCKRILWAWSFGLLALRAIVV